MTKPCPFSTKCLAHQTTFNENMCGLSCVHMPIGSLVRQQLPVACSSSCIGHLSKVTALSNDIFYFKRTVWKDAWLYFCKNKISNRVSIFRYPLATEYPFPGIS